jgi:hypothetical protein
MPRVRDGLVRLKPGGAFGSHVFEGTNRSPRTIDRPDGSRLALGAAPCEARVCSMFNVPTTNGATGLGFSSTRALSGLYQSHKVNDVSVDVVHASLVLARPWNI